MEKASAEINEATMTARNGWASPPGEKKLILRSSDGEAFEVELSAASQSAIIKDMIEKGCTDDIINVPNATGPVLAKVVEYWKKHAAGGGCSEEELDGWDAEYVSIEKDVLFQVIMAADFLCSKPLLDRLCQAVADTIKDMSVEECREYMGIENDFTPEEEAEIRAENSWAF